MSKYMAYSSSILVLAIACLVLWGCLCDIELLQNGSITMIVISVFSMVIIWNRYLVMSMEQKYLDIQHTLANSEQRLKLALESAKLGTWEWDLITGEIFGSAQSEQIAGLEPGSFVGNFEVFGRLIYPDDLEEMVISLEEAKLNQTNWEMDYRIIKPDHTLSWVSSSGKFIYNQAQEPIKMIGVILDISHRKKLEDKLRKINEELEKLVMERTLQLQEELLERRRTEIELQKYSARFAGILEIAQDAIISVDKKQNIILFNQGAENTFGYKMDEVLGKPLKILLPERFSDRHSQQVQIFARNYKEKSRTMGERGEIWGRHKDGTEFVAEASISKLEIDNEIILTAILRDISDRKIAQLALAKTESKYRRLIETTIEGVWELDQDGCTTFANPQMALMLGYGVEEMMGKHLFCFMDEEGKMIAQYNLERRRQGITEQHDFKFQRKDGSPLWTIVSTHPIVDDDGTYIGTIGMITDITDRKRLEQELALREAQLNAFFNAAPIGMVIHDDQFRFVKVNQVLADIHGKSVEDHIGLTIAEVLPDLAGFIEPILMEVLTTGQPILNKEFYAILPSNPSVMRYWICSYYPISPPNSDITWVGVVVVDISDRKQTELALEKAKEDAVAGNQAKSLFLANMSHELRSPLNAILGFSQLMERDKNLSDSHLDYLQIINRSGEHLLSLIDDILDLSKIESGCIEITPTNCDLNRWLNLLENMYQLKAQHKGLELIVERSPDLPKLVLVDQKKLRQVLINLLGNAIKFTHKGTITLKVGGHPVLEDSNFYQLSFRVEDTGVGIANSELDSLFKVFVQAEAGKLFNQGTGLGLTISQKFIQLMGGEIKVESCLGKGSIFYFEITVELSSSNLVSESINHQRVISLAPQQPRYRILIAEDQPDNRRLLLELLTGVGFEVQAAQNGAEAIKIWENWSPHLIWMDLRMPIMDGYEATKYIKEHSDDKPTIIIAISASVFKDERDALLEFGYDDFITKPFPEYLIWEKIAQYLKVEYIYETPVPDHRDILVDSLSSQDLADMSGDWLNQMYQAAYYLDTDIMNELIKEIPESHTDLINKLNIAVNNFDSDQIMELIKPLMTTSEGISDESFIEN